MAILPRLLPLPRRRNYRRIRVSFRCRSRPHVNTVVILLIPPFPQVQHLVARAVELSILHGVGKSPPAGVAGDAKRVASDDLKDSLVLAGRINGEPEKPKTFTMEKQLVRLDGLVEINGR